MIAHLKEPVKVIWAIDLFQTKKAEIIAAARGIEQLLLRLRPGVFHEVLPVYVMNPDHSLPVNLHAEWLKTKKETAKLALQELLSAVETLKLQEPRVLVQESEILNYSVQTLVDFAELEKTRVITLTGGHIKGLNRFFLESFSEALILSSSVPLFLLHPNSSLIPNGLDTALFLTDFSEKSFEAFEMFLLVAKDFNSKVIIYHKVSRPFDPIVQSGAYFISGALLDLKNYFRQIGNQNRIEYERWAELAQKVGVSISFEIDTSYLGLVHSMLRYVQEEKINWIALASQSNRLKTAFLGSIARQVVRVAPCPVWIVHPKPKSILASAVG